MLSNAYFLAKFRFDTAENEPAKNLQNFANFPNFCPRYRARAVRPSHTGRVSLAKALSPQGPGDFLLDFSTKFLFSQQAITFHAAIFHSIHSYNLYFLITLISRIGRGAASRCVVSETEKGGELRVRRLRETTIAVRGSKNS